MGYRSAVAYIIKFKDAAQREQFEELVKHRGNEHMIQALDELDKKDYYLVAQFDNVKWYESYDDVASHHALMEFARKVFPDDTAWRFVRIGEEIDDVEETGDDPQCVLIDTLYAVRSIHLDI